VEDESSLAELIQLNLELEGYRVTLATDGAAALHLARQGGFDLCLLDVMLPMLDGFELCRTLRAENNRIPILFLSARSSGADRVEGLRLGGDDYLTKPFNLEELLLRVSILIRRNDPPTKASTVPDGYPIGKNKVYFSTFEVHSSDGRVHTLSKREMEMLRFLTENEGRVVSRDEILTHVWGKDAYPSTRTIDNFIVAYRKMFEPDQKNPVHFQSIRGVGYKFVRKV
jgi:two-component system alkaline phosphatase synthesis response regulator PhoP